MFEWRLNWPLEARTSPILIVCRAVGDAQLASRLRSVTVESPGSRVRRPSLALHSWCKPMRAMSVGLGFHIPPPTLEPLGPQWQWCPKEQRGAVVKPIAKLVDSCWLVFEQLTVDEQAESLSWAKCRFECLLPCGQTTIGYHNLGSPNRLTP